MNAVVAARVATNRDRPPAGKPGRDGGRRLAVRGLLQAAGMSTGDGWDDRSTEADELHGLPMASLLDVGFDHTRYCAATAVDDRGRLADRTPLKVMGWMPGTPVTMSAISHAGIIVVRRCGPASITGHGHLRLSADIRHGCRVSAGDRLLVVAFPGDGLLVAYTPYALDTMATAYHASLSTEDNK